jgi:biopolymer transport protein ExbB
MKRVHLTVAVLALFAAPLWAQPPSALPATPVTNAVAGADREVKTVTQQWAQKLKEGGKTTVVQIVLSVIGFSYVIERLFRLRRVAIVPKGVAQEANALWQQGRYKEVEQLAESKPCTLTRILAFVVKHRHNPVADVSTTAGDMAAQELAVHTQRAYPIAVIATLEPLLGLLGTVFGMIDCFDVVALAGSLGDPSLLAGGISLALVTTAVGLVIAIPLLYFYHLFKSRTNLYAAILEKEITTLIAEWLMRKGPDDAH